MAIGVNLEGRKELLGLWLGQSEGAKFWLAWLTDLKSRGLGDVFVACIDGLSGSAEAIRAAYPQANVQLCLVHLVRAAWRYVCTQDGKKFTRNRKIYPNEESALKIVYMAIHEASKKWTTPIRHWKQALNHFAILYDGRMPEQTGK